MTPYKSRPIFIIVLAIIASIPAYSAQRLVPSQYATIQDAVNAASDSDEIIVSPGTYTGLTSVDKSLIIRSTDPNDPAVVGLTIIDGQFETGCFDFSTSDFSNRQFDLSGFTIQNGYSSLNRCIYLGNLCTLNLTKCCFQFNFSSVIYSDSSTLNLSGCKFIWNAAIPTDYIVSSSGPLTVSRCIFSHNYGTPLSTSGSANIYDSIFVLNDADGYASAIYGSDYDSTNIFNCTIADNTGSAAVNVSWPFELIITNCIFYRNSPSDFSYPPENVSYSLIQGSYAGEGNFYADPMFVDAGNPDPDLRDYHLRNSSSCINKGDPNYVLNWGELDIDGQPRFLLGTRIDVGADEVQFPAVRMTQPAGSEIWAANSVHKIKWQSANILSNFNFYYSTNAGSNWSLIASNVSNTGEYTWHLPDAASTQCLLKIEPVVYYPAIIYSGFDKTFTIHPDAPGPDINPVWPTENKNCRHTSDSDTPGPALGCTKWQFTTDSPLAGSPVIGKDGNICLLCLSGRLYTLDPDGNELWTFDANSTVLTSPAVGPDGTIYFGTESGRLFAISPQGFVRWTFDTFILGAYTPAVSADNKIYFGTADGTFYCLAPDGSEKWHYTIPPNGYWIAPILTPPSIGPDGTVYFGGLSTFLYAAEPNTGQIKWAKNFGRLCDPLDPNSNYDGGLIFSSAVIADDGTIYISPLYDSNLYALNPADGSIRWQTLLAAPTYYQINYYGQIDPRYQNPTVWSTPALGTDGTIYISCDDPNLHAINPDGSVKWVTRLGMVGAFTLAVGSDGFIYAASDDRQLYVVDWDGGHVACFQGQDWLSFPAITASHELIVADANNIVYCLSADCDGEMQSLHRPSDLSYDYMVDFTDFTRFAENWLFCTDSLLPCEYTGSEYYLPGDIDQNGYIDTSDLYLFSIEWLEY